MQQQQQGSLVACPLKPLLLLQQPLVLMLQKQRSLPPHLCLL
jgi:hypothetical protein